MTPPASSPTIKQSLSFHQPYTAPFLARLSTFILHAPLTTVKSALSSTSTHDGELPHIDPDSDAMRPTQYVNVMCQRLLRFLNELTLVYPRADYPSPDTIPLALCLLLRYRIALASTSQSEVTNKYEYLYRGGRFSAPISYPASRLLPGPLLNDVTLIAISVHIAYKFIAHDIYWVNLQCWALPFELGKQALLDAERAFLRVVDHRIWVRQDEYIARKGKFDSLWEDVFAKAAKPAPPEFVLRRLRGQW